MRNLSRILAGVLFFFRRRKWPRYHGNSNPQRPHDSDLFI